MPTESTEQDIYDVDGYTPKRVSRFTRWYRSPLFNVIVVGMISFTQPGIWNALNNVGAGGQQEPYLVNGANSLTFGIMVFGCSIFAILANKFGLKNILLLGTLGYAPYSASLYVNNRYGVEWFVLFGGATCGVAASALWASEGAIALGYADVHNRGKFTGIWLGLRELGQLIGSSIQLSLNYKSGERGKVGYTTYIVLIALQCLGLPLALLVSPPHKIYHRDGRKTPDPTKNKAVMKEVQRWWALLRDRRFFLLIPVMIGFNWNNTYQGIYLTKYFSVRARTLGSLTSGIAATVANIFWGWFYDTKFVSRPTLAKTTWGIFSLLMLGLFGWQVANEKMYASSKVTLDWDLPGFGRGFAVNVLFRFMNESHYMFVYWILGAFFDDIETLTLAVGLLRSFESVGSCLAFGIGAAKIEPMINLIIAFVMFAITIPSTFAATFLVPERPIDERSGEHGIVDKADSQLVEEGSLRQERAAARLLKSDNALATGRPGVTSTLEPTRYAAAPYIRSDTTSSSGPAQSDSSSVAERRERYAAASIAVAASRDRHDARLARFAERKASKMAKPAQREGQPAALVAVVAPQLARQVNVDLTDPFDGRPLKSDPEKIGKCHTANLQFEQRIAALVVKPVQVDRKRDCTATIESISSGKSSSTHSRTRQFEAGLRARQDRYEEARRKEEEDGKAERARLELKKRKKLDEKIQQEHRRFEERKRLKKEEEEANRRMAERLMAELREADRQFQERTRRHEEIMRLKEEEEEAVRQEAVRQEEVREEAEKKKEAERRNREVFARLQDGKRQMEERERILQGRWKRIQMDGDREMIESQIRQKKLRLVEREQKFEEDEEKYRLRERRAEEEG
ncbi:hypothetical protein G6011_03204 [Alternaria panax]|uniref:UNC93-like protein n=1 Tax=Alternaria panax TaxID=48097 RepID=A0AAD4IER5_9PLEO|nr:hypothetical protein G6011_03204 [Alternaria panax]